MFGRRKSLSNGTPPRDKTVPFERCPAKTFTTASGDVLLGRTVLNHCTIVGEVARELIARMPLKTKQILFPKSAPLVAAAHDIGKVSPTFFEKIRRACTVLPDGLETLPLIDPAMERQWGGHAGVSEVTAIFVSAPKFIPEVLGQHHGFSPPINGLLADDEIFGGTAWLLERQKLLTSLKAELDLDWPHIESAAQARLISGLTSVADWIGSGAFFENPEAPWRDNICNALDSAGLVPPIYKKELSFGDVFSGYTPLVTQQRFIDKVKGPGVYVLEAPMGLGKTEAALFAAYKMVSSGQASGIYFALPTQLTSNKIYDRFQSFLQQILAEECRHQSLLLHGSAWMLESTDMGEEGRPGGAWFSQAKRGLLAPFAVGTIDQALMSAMNVKHGFVRAFGLAGKVVILDEVHTYDSYTGTLLDALVDLLRQLHCTVIILSATLTRDRRQTIIGAPVSRNDYPLITALKNSNTDQIPVEIEGESSPAHHVNVTITGSEQRAVSEAFSRAEQGEQVLWIENTVNEAQKRFLDMASVSQELGISCGLLHSRFTQEDRQAIEDVWVNQLGKPGWQERQSCGRILVGTQVLEQSLDIDADFLVSRFAPTDMILQRLGRLWRHSACPRISGARCEAWIIAPDRLPAIEDPVTYFGASAFVYSPYVLCRSLAVWESLDRVVLPDDIRVLMDKTYIDQKETGAMAKWFDELENGTKKRAGRQALRQFANLTLSEGGKTLPESKAQTRFSEEETVDVLLVKSLERIIDKRHSLVTLLSGETVILPWDKYKTSKNEWRILSVKLMRQVVHVRVNNAPGKIAIDTLSDYGLGNVFYLGNPDIGESLLRLAFVDVRGHVSVPTLSHPDSKQRPTYRNDLGYCVVKQKR